MGQVAVFALGFTSLSPLGKNIHIAKDVRKHDNDNFSSHVSDLKSATFNNILSERQTHRN